MRKNLYLTLLFTLLCTCVSAQSAIIRGNIFDEGTGDPISFGTVQLTGPDGLNKGTNTDVDGFYSFSNLPLGDYTLIASYVGFETLTITVNIANANEIEYRRLQMKEGEGVQLQTATVSARRERARS